MTIFPSRMSNTDRLSRRATRPRHSCILLAMLLTCLPQWIQAQSFEDLDQAIDQGVFGNLNAVVASRHGEIIFEGYYRGRGVDDLHQVQSVTKSVGSALVGIAHRQGKIHLDQTLDEFFGDLYPMTDGGYQDKSGITVEQILQQRHGVVWDEDSLDYRNPQNPVNQMVNSNDWYRYFLSRPMDAPPGDKFAYSSGASNLMSRFIRVATDTGPEDYAMRELFEPLGISQVHWELYSEQGPGTGLTQWPAPDHDAPLAFALWLRARDMLKIGELYLNGGVYEGRRLLDQAWVDASWAMYSHSGNSDFFPQEGWGHGYQWWIAQLPDERGRNWQVFFASGWGSQVIFVLPELDLVLVTVGDNHDHNGPDVDSLLYTMVGSLTPYLDRRFSGSWFDPENDGQGFQLEVLDDRGIVAAFWYTYEPDGSGDQRWFLLQGDIDRSGADVTIYETTGGVFLQDDPYFLEEWGTGHLATVDCDHMELQIESGEINTTIPLTRITGVCFEAP